MEKVGIDFKGKPLTKIRWFFKNDPKIKFQFVSKSSSYVSSEKAQVPRETNKQSMKRRFHASHWSTFHVFSKTLGC